MRCVAASAAAATVEPVARATIAPRVHSCEAILRRFNQSCLRDNNAHWIVHFIRESAMNGWHGIGRDRIAHRHKVWRSVAEVRICGVQSKCARNACAFHFSARAWRIGIDLKQLGIHSCAIVYTHES